MKKFAKLTAIVLILCLLLPSLAFAKTYKQGDKGDEIMLIKARMFALGYYTTMPTITTYNDTMTERVKQLQKNNGLKQTGKIDEALYELLFSENVIAANGKPAGDAGTESTATGGAETSGTATGGAETSGAATVSSGEPVIKKGDRNSRVQALKKRMQELLYYDPDQSVSNEFNDTMTDRVKILQKTNNLAQTGVVTGELYDFILSDACIPCGGWYDEEMTIQSGYRYKLSGEKQYSLSASGNVVIFIIDYLANNYLDNALRTYPKMLAPFNDFTYYDNCDPRYIGTFPSLCHMLTGEEFDPTLMIGEWFKKAWTSERTQYIYDTIHALGYKVFYYYNPAISGGMKQDALGKIDNLIDTGVKGHAKPAPIYTKADFYKNLQSKGLTVDQTEDKYIQYIHLRGCHAPYTVDANGNAKSNATRAENIAGYMKMVADYIEIMKQNGTYDNSTIIITADHGDKDVNLQVIYFIKEANTRRESMATSTAPISHRDFVGTIFANIGADYSAYGTSIYDFKPGDKRQRSCGVVGRDANSFPLVPCYSDPGLGSHNFFKTFTYTGDRDDLLKQIKRRNFSIELLSQSFN